MFRTLTCIIKRVAKFVITPEIPDELVDELIEEHVDEMVRAWESSYFTARALPTKLGRKPFYIRQLKIWRGSYRAQYNMF